MVTKVSGTEGVDQVKAGTLTIDDAKAGQAVGFNRMQLFAAQDTTSGTFKDFTGIPSWAKRVTVLLNGVSTNGASIIQIQIGAGSIDTTGYLGTVDTTYSSGSSPADVTSGLALDRGAASVAAVARTGRAVFELQASNTWVANYLGRVGPGFGMSLSATGKTLSGILDRIRLTTVNGTDTFDAGSVSILVEGYE